MGSVIKRVEGWEHILADELWKARSLRFEWGVCDCVIWSANVVLAMTGVDLMADIRGAYHSQLSAYRIIKEKEGTLEACVSARLAKLPLQLARRGDIIRWEHSLGICAGEKAFFLTESQGIQPVPLIRCESAWKVG